MKKWYVFDRYDCFDHCATLEQAAKAAAWLIGQEFEGVHIKEMTAKEFEEYLKTA
jgi:hypothetical protein